MESNWADGLSAGAGERSEAASRWACFRRRRRYSTKDTTAANAQKTAVNSKYRFMGNLRMDGHRTRYPYVNELLLDSIETLSVNTVHAAHGKESLGIYLFDATEQKVKV